MKPILGFAEPKAQQTPKIGFVESPPKADFQQNQFLQRELLTAHTFLGLTIPILLQLLDRYIHITLSRNMSLLLSAPILAATVYAAIAGAYLLVIPLMVMFYFKARWYKTGSLERVFLCFLAFFFFPGLLLLSPFFNFRPEARQI